MTDRVDGADFPCEAVNFLLGRIRTYALCSNVYINFFPPLYVYEMVVSPRRLHFLIRVPCSSSVFFSPISWKTLPCHQLRKQSDRAPPRFEEKVANQLMGEDRPAWKRTPPTKSCVLCDHYCYFSHMVLLLSLSHMRAAFVRDVEAVCRLVENDAVVYLYSFPRLPSRRKTRTRRVCAREPCFARSSLLWPVYLVVYSSSTSLSGFDLPRRRQ